MKLHLLLLSLYSFSHCLYTEASNFLEIPQAKLQRFVGEFSQDPISIFDCYDQNDLAITQDLLIEIFRYLDNGKMTDVPSIIESYKQRLSPNAIECLSKDQKLQNAIANKDIFLRYVLDYIRPLSTKDQESYLTTLEQLSIESQNEDSKQSEKISSGADQVPDDDPVSDLKQVYEGFFAQAQVNGTVSVINCYNATSAKLTLNVLSAVLLELSTDQFGDINNLLVQYKKYLPSSVETCVNQDQELQEAYQKYKITGMSLNTIFAAISSYAQSNYDAFHSISTVLNIDCQAESYTAVGMLIGRELLTIFV